jgi:hypothetical protein
MVTSHIIPSNSFLFLTRARLRPPRHSTVTDRITRCRRRRCQLQQPQRQSRPPPLPHDTPIICARYYRQSGRIRCADPRYSSPSTKTGAGVSEVFACVACRVVTRWEREEAHASGPVVGNGSTVHLADAMTGGKKPVLRWRKRR